MKRLSELLPSTKKEIADQCSRMTGMTPEEWDAVYSSRRKRDLGGLNLTGARLFTEHEKSYSIKYYGLEEEDFERVIVKLDNDVSVSPEFHDQLTAMSPTNSQFNEIVKQELRQKNVIMRDGFLTGKNTKDRDTTIKSVIRHRIIQDSLQRIAAE